MRCKGLRLGCDVFSFSSDMKASFALVRVRVGVRGRVRVRVRGRGRVRDRVRTPCAP